ncbi:MAG: hypothetical protein RBS78_00955 [Coriobacteriia bacterium]|jgi:hypothetical protein|nr:hypothetical protein [Coriobacteriia bacterium]
MAGINVSNQSAAGPEPTVNTVGRTQLTQVDFGGLGRLVGNLVKNVAGAKEDKLKADMAKAANTAALEQEEIQFQVLSDSPQEKVAAVVDTTEDELGVSMSPEAKAGLEKIAAERSRVGTLLESIPEKDRERKLDLAMRKHRIEFLKKYPEYGLEALVASGKLVDYRTKTDVHFRDEAAERDKAKAEDDALRTFYRSQGISVPVNMPPEALQADYNMRFGPQIQEFTAGERALKTLQNRRDLNAAQREVAQEEIRRGLRPVFAASATSAVQLALTGTEPVEVRAQRLADTRLQLQQKIMEDEGLYDPAEVEKQYGAVFALLDNAQEALNKGATTTSIEAQNRLFKALTARDIYKEFGSAPEVIQQIILPFSNVLGPTMMDTVFAPPAPGEQPGLGYQVLQQFSQFQARNLKGAAGGDPFAPLVKAREGSGSADPAAQRQGERAQAQVTRGLVDTYANLPEQAKRGAADYIVATIKSPYAAQSGTAWADVVDAMDSPNFPAFLDASGRKGEIDQTVVVNTRNYARSLLVELNGRTAGVTPEWVVDLKAGTITVKPESIASLPQAQRDAINLGIRRLSTGLRVLNKRFGQGNDITDILAEMEAMGQ